jgi:hypothetical protein
MKNLTLTIITILFCLTSNVSWSAGETITYTGITHTNTGNDNVGEATLVLGVDQNGDFTGTGVFTFTSSFIKQKGPHSGLVTFTFCAPWAFRGQRGVKPAGTFDRTEQFQLGWGQSEENWKNCNKSRAGKVKANLDLLSGSMGGVLKFTVANSAYRKNQRNKQQQEEKKAAATALEARNEIPRIFTNYTTRLGCVLILV